MEDEREQRGKAESRLEKEVVTLTTEKSRLVDRIDTLEQGNERFFQMKEQQVNETFFSKPSSLD